MTARLRPQERMQFRVGNAVELRRKDDSARPARLESAERRAGEEKATEGAAGALWKESFSC